MRKGRNQTPIIASQVQFVERNNIAGAIVTKVHGDGTLGMTVFFPHGIEDRDNVPALDANSERGWRWPE
jgi:hypothetical protein